MGISGSQYATKAGFDVLLTKNTPFSHYRLIEVAKNSFKRVAPLLGKQIASIAAMFQIAFQFARIFQASAMVGNFPPEIPLGSASNPSS